MLSGDKLEVQFPVLRGALDVLQFDVERATESVEVSLRVETTTGVEAKELVCAAYAVNSSGEALEVTGATWPWSRKLGAPYQYLPRIDLNARVDLRPFRSESGFSSLVLALYPWGQATASVGAKFGNCLAGERRTIDGRQFVIFRSLGRAERKNG